MKQFLRCAIKTGGWAFTVAMTMLGEAMAQSSIATAATPPAATHVPHTAGVLCLPPTRERPAHRGGVAIGGTWPQGAVLELEGLWGLAPFVAARTSLSALWTPTARHPRERDFDGVVLLGADMALDTFAWVPHVFLEGGARLAPAAPAVAFGASLERFVSLRTRVQVTAMGLWRGHGGGARAQLLLGVGRTLN